LDVRGVVIKSSSSAMLLALAVGACGGISVAHRHEDSGGTEAQPVVFTRLPVDFRAQCPAQGCTLNLEPSNWSGVWWGCPIEFSLPSFDATTYDFAGRCASSLTVYTKPRFANDESLVSFMDRGTVYDWSDWCTARQVMLGPAGEMLTPSCGGDASDTRLLELHAWDWTAYQAADGSRYRYNVTQGVQSVTVKIETLVSDDTSTLVEGCSRRPSNGGPCDGPGISFPFGPSGVGPAPPPELTRSWLDCDWLHGAAVTDDEIVEQCASALAALEVGDAAPNGRFYRFNADGTLDSIGVRANQSTCRWATVGATPGQLKLFYCGIEPDTRLGSGMIATATDTYEIRAIAGRDYLIWQRYDYQWSYGYTIAVAEPLFHDFCAAATLPACVLGGSAP
jgi:hypothetical protein